MAIDPGTYSPPARVAEPDEGITLDELALAARNHAMPLEVLRYDVTPPGLHYVLAHYDIPLVDAETWRLDVGGCVGSETSYDLAGLRALPRHSHRVTLECAGNGRAHLSPRPLSQPWLTGAVGTADWAGARLVDVLDAADLDPGAVDVVFSGADHGFERGGEDDYRRSLSLADARNEDILVAYEMNGGPIPVQHGHPVRLVVPGWYGMAHVKWLREITVLDHAFKGYQNAVAYRIKQDQDDSGTPVSRIEPRALLVPPGHPDFMSRIRVLRPGTHVLEGRAWSGWAPISRVEISVDGANWVDAALDPPTSPYAWRRFTAAWEAAEGVHRLRVRAHDESGRAQPVEHPWNRGGFANNAAEPLVVVVTDGPDAVSETPTRA
jgi:sulfite dehydrogenase (cytochrome) subunit A